LADGADLSKEIAMARAIGILLILAGMVALVYGGFDLKREEHLVAVGPARITLVDDHELPLPPLAGVIALGAGLLLFVLSVPRARPRVGP
jgi:hypothetical protein